MKIPINIIWFMEIILHISYNVDFKKWSVTTTNNKGLEIQKKAQNQITFVNYHYALEITCVDEELIKRFYVILPVMWSGKAICV